MNAMTDLSARGLGELALSPAAAPTETATVRTRTGRDATVMCGEDEVAAQVAFGCLVRPEAEDKVLIARDAGQAWILSVLHRASDAPTCLYADGDVALVSARGRVSLLAGGDVDIAAGRRAKVTGQEIALHGGVAHFVLDELTQIGRRANLYIAKIRSVGDMVETFAAHVLTRANRATRFIEASDQLRAGDIDHRAESTMRMHAKTAFIDADTVVRIDADQIHMG